MSDNKKVSFQEVKKNFNGNGLNNLKSDMMSLCIFYEDRFAWKAAIMDCINEIEGIFSEGSE